MMVARWHIQAKFGHKQALIELLKTWDREIGAKAGLEADRFRILTGSVGGREADIESEVEIRDLSELNAFFEKLAQMPEHADFAKRVEPHMVSGSTYWTVYRLIQ
ncbi:MAG: hypothetical protein H3C38_10075 [Rhodospirillales bacterium]|nr:hypothetical protein [Rhodospirillales bacterium]